jgi:predicted dehydrogenase
MRKTLESRRDFMAAALSAGGLTAVRDLVADERKKTSPNERLDVAVIGVGGQGAYNLANVAFENVVALCDVDRTRLDKALAEHKNAQGYADFREMLSAHPNLDAVVVATPDHTHAVAAAAALKLGKHVYCEKPLTHTVSETRRLRELAKEKNLVTQLGTQIHAGDNYRKVVAAIRSGAIGKVNKVHVYFSGRPQVFKTAAPKEPPKTLAYDLWLGPTEPCPYVPEQSHFHWRYWWKFGNGVLGDFGCHFMDLAFWALELGATKSVASTAEKDHDGVNDVPGKQKAEYVFDGKSGDIQLTWWHGGDRPAEAKGLDFGSGVLFLGDQGMLVSDYGRYKLLPEEKFKGYQPPTMIEKSIGHHREWLKAIRTGGPTTCNFEYSGNLTEAVLLGNAAFRGAPGKTLVWDAANLKFSGDGAADANRFIQHAYRNGWSL